MTRQRNPRRARLLSPWAEEFIASVGLVAVIGALAVLAIYGAALTQPVIP